VNGFLSGSSQTIFTDPQVSSIALGVVSLFTGVLSTLGSYFAWAKRTEAHRISSIQYQKISKFLTIELSLPKVERVAAKDILKITREQIERLMEISPAVPESILRKYRSHFKDIEGVAQPEVIQGLKKVRVNTYVEDTGKHSNVKIEFKNALVLRKPVAKSATSAFGPPSRVSTPGSVQAVQAQQGLIPVIPGSVAGSVSASV
jgi:hypothetical protein